MPVRAIYGAESSYTGGTSTTACTNHRLVYIQGTKKLCEFCRLKKIRTKSGWFIYAKTKCQICDVPLCNPTSDRDCFRLFHNMLECVRYDVKHENESFHHFSKPQN